MANEQPYDAIVVGSGLAGLMAGLTLQKANKRVLILERRSVPGGLCGTFVRDGYEFVIGCNDFGDGLARDLHALGVDVAFHRPKARFYYGGGYIQIPPDFSTVLRLIGKAPGLARAIYAAKRRGIRTFGELIEKHIRDPQLANLACVLVYALGCSPDDLPLSSLRESLSKKFGYGYHKSSTPVGGPGVMVARMVERFRALGGELRLGCECTRVDREGALKRVVTPQGEHLARAVLSSRGRWDEYPREKKRGLEVAMLLVALRKDFLYPRGFHTIGWFAPGAAQWLSDLDAGRPHEPASFHLFRSDLPEQADHYTVNVATFLPRGERALSPSRKNALVDYLLGTIDSSILPGFRSALLYSSLVTPEEYEALHRLVPAPSPWIPPAGFQKPPSYDPRQDIYFLGTSVYPPGEHAGAAALSGRLAAREVLATLS